MGKIEKLILKLLSNPKDFTWDELQKLLSGFGYKELKKARREAHEESLLMKMSI